MNAVNNIKLSIVVPVYNVEKYLYKCLLSLVSQSLKDIEIIIINDGSTDDSQGIIDYFKKLNPNMIKSVQTENRGLAAARNLGLELCQGEYVAFVDSDDFVDTNMFKKMYDEAKKNNHDVVACDYNEIYEDHDVVRNCGISAIDKKIDLKKSIFSIIPVVWNKIYKRSILDNGFRFTDGIKFEDIDFTYKLLPFISSIGKIKEPLYNYVQRDNSISHSYNNENMTHVINVWNGLYEYYQKLGLFESYKDELEYSYFRYVYNMFDRMPSCEKNKSYDIFCDNIRKNVNRGNKYIRHIEFPYQIWGGLPMF